MTGLYTPELEAAARHVAAAFNEAGVRWAIGGSALLRRIGFPETPNDLDVMVALSDADAAHEALQKLGVWERGEPKPPFASRCFCRYTIGGITVETIAGFRIEHAGGMFELPFESDEDTVTELPWYAHEPDVIELRCSTDKASVVGPTPVAGTPATVPYSLPEHWWLSYRLMPSASKQEKAKRLYRLLLACGITRPDRFRRLLQQPLPPEVRMEAERLLLADL
jgi:hypothetical protein